MKNIKEKLLERVKQELDNDDEWAKVELYRWQYDTLEDLSKTLDVSVALIKVAESIEKACKNKDMKLMPTPMNLCSILRYSSRLIRDGRKK